MCADECFKINHQPTSGYYNTNHTPSAKPCKRKFVWLLRVNGAVYKRMATLIKIPSQNGKIC
ncbi:hypothetical protein B0181_00885 [Moraxella caviae]|uniref:Uncharacterized protein n=1 Tax=Moraxella caviae TaxID=34060 RepID=A0A1T0ABM9_9GAMM|nr:hypothetical protein B0181_00885 [Moraxella caviae]